LLSNFWRWKNLVLTGEFNENKFYYIGRNLPLIGFFLSVNFLVNKDKKAISLLMLLIYTIVSFVNPRRDPIIERMLYVLIPFVLFYRKRIWKFILISIPVGIAFFVLFIELTKQLTFGEDSILHSMGSYTFGSFSALSNAIEIGYPSNTDLPLGNTFYFVYTILKYPVPELAPPDIVLVSLNNHSVNVYTSLIAPLIDSKGDGTLLILYVFIYSVFIGAVIALMINLYNKYHNISSLYLLCSCSSCAIRSFFNPTFSYLEILPAFVIAILIAVFFKETLIISFGNKNAISSSSLISKKPSVKKGLINKEEL
jgi:oligosaccharide repeat unit polymerase